MRAFVVCSDDFNACDGAKRATRHHPWVLPLQHRKQNSTCPHVSLLSETANICAAAVCPRWPRHYRASQETAATVKNASGKQIVAVAINVEARCGLLGTQMVYTHDMMFKPSGFVPDELISLAVADLDMGMSGDVQFADQHGHNRGGSLHRSDT